MTLEQPISKLEDKPSITGCPKSGQRFSKQGKILVSKKAWVVRIATLVIISSVAAYNIQSGWQLGDQLVVYSTLMIVHLLAILCVGWIFYVNPTKGHAENDLVSVIIPIYNQRSVIEIVIDSIYLSTYKNIEVIAINDGSKDGTKEILDELAKKYPTLKVIHKKNEGKRKAVAAGFYASKGKCLVLIDSDSTVDDHAIEEFMKTFNGDSEVGAAVGHVKVWNAGKNVLTKCQDAWYDYAFNIYKTCESTFGSVTCCSGCLACYRREAIANFIPYWAESQTQYADDRQLTSYAIATPWVKKQLAPVSQTLMESMARYDDSEDRGLTAYSLVQWKSVYVASAVAYTDVPENLKGFLKQQQRWKKGYIRTNFFVSSFFWIKNPIISLIYYLDFMTAFTLPLIALVIFFYEPFILKNFWIPIVFISGFLLAGFTQGLDYKFRDPTAKNWMYRPLMNLMSYFVLSWLVFPALWNYRKNEWLTR